MFISKLFLAITFLHFLLVQSAPQSNISNSENPAPYEFKSASNDDSHNHTSVRLSEQHSNGVQVDKNNFLNKSGFDKFINEYNCEYTFVPIFKCTGIHQLPQNIRVPDAFRYINLSANKIADLWYVGDDHKEYPSFTEGPSVETLDLSNNRLTTLKGQDFHALSGLKELNLSGNLISSIKDCAFYGLKNLRVIDLGHNTLQELASENTFVFEEFKPATITTLILHHNKLKSLDKEVFRQLKNLQVLDFSHNLFTSQSFEAVPWLFSWSTNLKEVNLKDNRLAFIPNNTFNGLILKSLDLSMNDFVKISWKEFEFFNVEELKLNNMAKMEDIGSYTFSNLTNLRRLSIEYNLRLRKLQSTVFETDPATGCGYIESLEELSLKGNKLITLNNKTLPASLKKLDLEGNPWNCLDKDISWIGSSEIVSSTVQCEKPKAMKGKLIKEVKAEDMKPCPANSH